MPQPEERRDLFATPTTLPGTVGWWQHLDRVCTMDYSRILEALYVGSYPKSSEDVRILKEACGITAVVNLQTDDDLRVRGQDWATMEAVYAALHIHVERVPMRDFDYKDQRRRLPDAVKTLAKLLAAEHTVYLHCSAGLGRSPLVAMAYLYWCQNESLKGAITAVEKHRSCSPMKELLEVTRQDVLKDKGLRERIEQRAFELHVSRSNQPDNSVRNWLEAEREILKEILC